MNDPYEKAVVRANNFMQSIGDVFMVKWMNIKDIEINPHNELGFFYTDDVMNNDVPSRIDIKPLIGAFMSAPDEDEVEYAYGDNEAFQEEVDAFGLGMQ